MGRLRRRATIARKGITQILETAAEYHLDREDWASLARETRTLAMALKKVERPEEMALGVMPWPRRAPVRMMAGPPSDAVVEPVYRTCWP